jgi:nucleoside phosphorylase
MSEIPTHLANAVRDGRVVPFAGAGIAMALTGRDGRRLVPSWRELLSVAVERLAAEQRHPQAEALRVWLEGDPTFADPFRFAQQALGPLFPDFLRENLDPARDQIAEESLGLARALWRLSSGLVVTIAHDRALTWACPDPANLEVISPSAVPGTLQRLGGGLFRPAIWHVFGTLADDTAIFTLDGNRSLLPSPGHDQRIDAAAPALRLLFSGPHSVLFVGTSAPENFSTGLFLDPGATHYWFVLDSQLTAARYELRRRDLKVVHPVGVPSWDDLPALLHSLADERTAGSFLGVHRPSAGAAASAEPATAVPIPQSGEPQSQLVPLAAQAAASSTRPAGRERDQPFDVAIICALHQTELASVRKTGGAGWQVLPSERDDPQTYHASVYTTKRGRQLRVVAAAPGQMGLSASAVLATKMILRFHPKLVAMVGIAAGAKEGGQGFGDILSADQTFDYGSGKIVIQDEKLFLKPDPKPLAIAQRLKDRLLSWQADGQVLDDIRRDWPAALPPTPLRLHVGPLASGAAVVDAAAQVKEIEAHWRKLIGVEMEAYAVHRACNDAVEPAPAFLCFKSICDFAEGKTDDWQPYAAYTAASFCHRFLCTEWEDLYLDRPSSRVDRAAPVHP